MYYSGGEVSVPWTDRDSPGGRADVSSGRQPGFIAAEPSRFLLPDGRLDFRLLLEKFAAPGPPARSARPDLPK
jgi:hypothetical protein